MTVLYFAFLFCQIFCELQVIDVNNYCDLSIHMQNAGDELHINVPEKTLFFVSSTDGYEVFALVTTFVPNEMNRLFYTHHMNTFFVTSTKDNIDFCFHTLVLTKIQVPVDHIFISSNPSERFYIYHYDLLNNEDPTDCSYNATFSKNHLIWFLGDNRTLCDITTRIYEPYTNLQHKYTGRLTYPSSFAFPFTDPTNESNIYFETIYLTMANKITLASKSKLIYIEKVKELYYGFTSYFQMKCTPENETNYYIDYRAYVNYTELSDNKVITRGKEHYEKLQKLIIYNGITYIDFSIYNNYYIEKSGYILIFPKITEMSSNILFDDNITFMYKHNKELTFNSAIDHVAETDINAPIIAIDEYYFNNIDSYFILSTCPTEKLIIGSSYQNDINYTNNVVYQYIMGSLQDIQTTITFEGKVTIAKIENEDIKNITINSGDTIDGCFIAYIEKYAKCKFETSPKGELKKGYYDDARTMFKNPRNLKENLFISPKYGDYYNTTVSFKNESVSFENRDFQIVSTFNLVYVQNKDGWNAEVLYPKVKEYNKIGPEYNITSFYFSQLPKGRRVVIKFNKENNDYDFVLRIRTTSTEYINQGDDFYCQRLVLFNEFPSKYSVNFKQNSQYRQINLDYYETFCMFPAISDFYYGRNKAYFDHYNAYGNGFGFVSDDKIEDETYCRNITTYYNYQSETYPIMILKWTSNLGNIAFKSASSDYYDDPDDLLPDEPKFYINTKINRTFGIHPLKNQYEDIGNTEDDSDDDDNDDNGNDDPDDNKQNVNIELVNVTSYEEVNMKSFVNYTIKSGSYSLIIIHSNINIEAEVFVKENGNTNSIGTIKSNSADKIIYYGANDGYILVRKSSKNTKSSSDLDNKFIYSYINLEKVDYLDSYKCNDILISSDPNVNFSIGGPESNETSHFNLTLSNYDKFCMWFPFPIVAIVSSNSYLPNFQSLVVDKKQLVLSYTEYAFAGKSFLYTFKYGSSGLNDRNATYNAEPKYSSDLPKLPSFYKINKIFKLDDKYGILSDQPKVVEKSDKKKFEINIAVIAYIAAAVIVIVIIIVVIVVCVKKKNKMKVSNNEKDTKAQNQSNQKNLQSNQTFPNQNYPNQNYPNQNYPNQNYPNQNYPNQNYPNQNYPNQNYPNQNYPNQNYPNQNYPYPPNPCQVYPKPYQNQLDPNQSYQNQNDQETP